MDATHLLGLTGWQWLALAALAPTSWAIGLVLDRPVRWLALRVTRKTRTEFDDQLVQAAHAPTVLLLATGVARAILPQLALTASAEGATVALIRILAIVGLFWLLLRAIKVIEEGMPSSAMAQANPALRSVIPLVTRIGRVLIVAVAILTIVSEFGYSVATILAGLGIGGIAIALGAQKSLEHVFGSVSLGVDQPFRVGDWVMVDGIEGTVETIGLRSTRFRTMDRTLVTIPNGQLAEARSENFDARERIRFRSVVRLALGTPGATISRIRDDIEKMLRAHRLTWPDRVVVRLMELARSSLDLEVFCWVETRNVDEFRAAREEHLLGILRIVENAGARLATIVTAAD